MCTVLVTPQAVLALRDERVGREFDDPGAWWPDQPGVVGGRDRAAGGTWCATDVATGVTTLVLNRPERREAAPGAPSRGVLPLRALQHGASWPEHVDVTGMASFALLLVHPSDPGAAAAGRAGATSLWRFDGERLRVEQLDPTAMVTSGGDEDGKADRHLADLLAHPWPEVLARRPPTDDPSALVVRHEGPEGQVFATVFGQVVRARPGELLLESSRTPWVAGSWSQQLVRPPDLP